MSNAPHPGNLHLAAGAQQHVHIPPGVAALARHQRGAAAHLVADGLGRGRTAAGDHQRHFAARRTVHHIVHGKGGNEGKHQAVQHRVRAAVHWPARQNDDHIHHRSNLPQAQVGAGLAHGHHHKVRAAGGGALGVDQPHTGPHQQAGEQAGQQRVAAVHREMGHDAVHDQSDDEQRAQAAQQKLFAQAAEGKQHNGQVHGHGERTHGQVGEVVDHQRQAGNAPGGKAAVCGKGIIAQAVQRAAQHIVGKALGQGA